MKQVALLAATAMTLGAGPLLIGPIALSGTGDFFDLGGAWGLDLAVSGSNQAGDWLYIGGQAVSTDTDLSSWSSPVGNCALGMSFGFRACQLASINGITGIGAFSHLGGGAGVVQVYEQGPYTGSYGPLLAEAQIMSYTQVTRYPDARGRGYFDILATPATQGQSETGVVAVAPEPSTLLLLVLAGLPLIRQRRLRHG